jgi:hypothetical protein
LWISSAPLSADQCATFARDGYLGPLDVLTADEVADVREAIAAVIVDLDRHAPQLYEVEQAHTERPGEVVCHFLGGFRVHPVLRELVFHPRITALCAQLLRVQKLRLWHDQVFAKPPHHPGVVPWHQDYSYWTRTTPPCHITCNVMLERIGGSSYSPGPPGLRPGRLTPPQPLRQALAKG